MGADASMIDDPEDKKPDDWVEDKRIVDAEAKKPDDWDDEEDGEWEAPMKDNPDYKGEGSVKRISNPEYEDDDSLYAFEDFGFIGFDLWQVKGGTIFDNIIITDDKSEADEFAKKWKALSEVEKEKKKEADAAKAAEAAANEPAHDHDDDDDDDEEDKEEM